MNHIANKKNAVVIGAGPAGLTSADGLVKSEKFQVYILEKDFVIGGLSKTTEYKNCKFDIGPHHFLTHDEKVEKWWLDLMKDQVGKKNEFIKLQRFTRIYYKKHFFHYPLQAYNVITGLNLFECIACVLSYIKITIFPIKNVKSFQDWVTNKFGYRLFSIFFKTYTEKVWGIECAKISSDWASQRIKGFSLSKAIFYAFFGKWFKKNAPRTLADKFYYPLQGAGTLWNKVGDNLINSKNCQINLNQEVINIEHENFKIKSVRTSKDTYKADYFLSTMPLKELILYMFPAAPQEIIFAAQNLKYRALITVNLIVNKKDICPDHWLYIHEKEVIMGRIGNMNNFSLNMVDNSGHTALSLEYFTFIDDEFYKKSDQELVNLAKEELDILGLVKKDLVLDGMILRVEQAYPVYDENYKYNLDTVLNYLAKFENLELMGRNGLHRYNNMDLAMITAFEAVDRIMQKESVRMDSTSLPTNEFIETVRPERSEL